LLSDPPQEIIPITDQKKKEMRNVLKAETLPGLFPGWGILDAVILHLGNEPDENGLSLRGKCRSRLEKTGLIPYEEDE